VGACLAFRVDGGRTEILAERDDNDFFIMFNGGAESERFAVCAPPAGKKWARAADTSLPSPADILPAGSEEPLDNQGLYTAAGRSVV